MPGRIHPDDLQTIKDTVKIEEVIGAHVTLQPGGSDALKGMCPFHEDVGAKPTFTVRPVQRRWHCFGCGEGGDALEFVQRIDSLSFTEAVEQLASRLELKLRYVDAAGAVLGPPRVAAPPQQRPRKAPRKVGVVRVRFLVCDPTPQQRLDRVVEVPAVPRTGETVMVPWADGPRAFGVEQVVWTPADDAQDVRVFLSATPVDPSL